jgi:hypothetical protein
MFGDATTMTPWRPNVANCKLDGLPSVRFKVVFALVIKKKKKGYLLLLATYKQVVFFTYCNGCIG